MDFEKIVSLKKIKEIKDTVSVIETNFEFVFLGSTCVGC